jgi:transcriptional regulator NrdR family protein
MSNRPHKRRMEMRCPRCHAPMNVEDGRGLLLNGEDVAIRYRRCKRCRIRVRTEERINWEDFQCREAMRNGFG